MSSESPLDRLVDEVRASAKYRRVSQDVIRRLGATELAHHPRLKDAVKATKNKLHQVGSAYLEAAMSYDTWLDRLTAARAVSEEAFRAACQDVMRAHASTRERLPILAEFYAALLGDLGPIHTLLDVACGLNALALPWMPLAPGASYIGCDIYEDMVAFVRAFLPLAGMTGDALTCDLGAALPTRPADVALALKTIPCLEQTDKAAGLRLIEGLPAHVVIVSFPVRSLGGRQKGMAEHYEAHLRDLLSGRDWPVERFEFASELAFRITKQPAR